MTHRTQRLCAAIIVILIALFLISPVFLRAGAEPNITYCPPEPPTPRAVITCDEPEQPTQLYSDADAVMIAQVMYNESRGIQSATEQACIAWTILNRADAWNMSISQVITQKHQFAYKSNTPVWDSLLSLSYDVLSRWQAEHDGETDVGRVLPSDYLWYSANKAQTHNIFRNAYIGGTRWDYSLPSPYSD